MRAFVALVYVAAMLLGAVAPRVALATPSLDACTGVLRPDLAPNGQLVVNTAGTWCLDRDLDWDAQSPMDPLGWGYPSMILVKADDVTIDCRGHRLRFTGTVDPGVNAIGIGAFPAMRYRLVVRNCQLDGFTMGMFLSNNDGLLVEDNVVTSSLPGDDLYSDGTLYATGQGIVRRNRIYASVHKAIKVGGDINVIDNLVDGVVDTDGGSDVRGIELYAPGVGEVRGNVIRGLRHDPAFGHVDPVFGVIVDDDQPHNSRVRVSDNVLALATGTPSIGVFCNIDTARVRFADNVFTGVEQDDVGCTDAGDNDLTP